jgi:tRNA nucleotidyltransferase/poly(A) polymerase
VGAELRLALAEPDPVGSFAALRDLGALAALDPRLGFEEDLARRALAMLPEDGRPETLVLAVALGPLAEDPESAGRPPIFEFMDRLEFTAAEREAVARTAIRARSLLAALDDATRPSQVREAAVAGTLEAVALAGALAEEQSPRALGNAREWLRTWHGVRLAITGEDLISAGVPAGPEIGRRLAAALARRLDGELSDGRDAELRAALEAEP